MDIKNHYVILGVRPEANQDEIQRAFEIKQQYCSSPEILKQINEAYAILSDPESRAIYDKGRGRKRGGRASVNPSTSIAIGRREDSSFMEYLLRIKVPPVILANVFVTYLICRLQASGFSVKALSGVFSCALLISSVMWFVFFILRSRKNITDFLLVYILCGGISYLLSMFLVISVGYGILAILCAALFAINFALSVIFLEEGDFVDNLKTCYYFGIKRS